MSVKKILSLAVVLAMVMAVVPTFGLVAGAAAAEMTDEVLLAYAKEATPDFDGARDIKSGVTPGDSAVNTVYEGWNGGNGNSDIEGITVTRSDGNNGTFLRLNVSDGKDTPRLQIYTAYKTKDEQNGAQNTQIVTTPKYGEGRDWVLFSFIPDCSAKWGDVAIMDGDKYVTAFRMGDETNTVCPIWGLEGWGSPYNGGEDTVNGKWGGPSFTVKRVKHQNYFFDDGRMPVYMNGSKSNTNIDILIAKTGDNEYKVTYFKDGEKYDEYTHAGAFNGIQNLKMNLGRFQNQWDNIGLRKIVISSGNYPDAADKVMTQTALNNIDLAFRTSTENITLPAGVTVMGSEELPITWTSDKPEVISNAGVVTPVKKVTYVTLTPSAKYGEETLKGTAHTVVVFPASAKGVAQYGIDEGEFVGRYKIGAESKLPSGLAAGFEGDNAISVTGWSSHTGADTNLADYAFVDGSFEAVPEGDWAYGSRWADEIATGKNNYCTFETFFPVEAGTYYLSFYMKKTSSADNNALVTLHFAENPEHTWTKPTEEADQYHVVTAGGNWEKKEYIITAATKGSIVFTADRLGGSDTLRGVQFDDFELYTAEKLEENLETVEEIADINIATGTTPVLPKTVKGTYNLGTVKDLEIAWESLEGKDFTNNTDTPKVVTVKGTVKDGSVTKDVAVNVNVYYSFKADKLETVNGQPAAWNNKLMFPAKAIGKLALEFDVEYTGVGDLWLDINSSAQIGSEDGNFFNNGSVLLGMDKDTAKFNPRNGKGDGNAETNLQETIRLNNKYHFIVNIDMTDASDTDKNGKYSVIAYDAATKEVLGNVKDHGFRRNVEELDMLNFFTNNGQGGGQVTNIVGKYGETLTIPDTFEVTVNYVVATGGKSLGTVKKSALKDGSITFDACEYRDGKDFYKAGVQTVTGVTAAKTVEVVLEKDDSKILSSTAFSYNFSSNKVIWAGDNGFQNLDPESGLISIGWGNFRETIMAFKLPEITDKQMIKSAVLNTTIGFVSGTNNKGEYKVYAIDPSYVDVAAGTMKNLPDFNDVRTDVKDDKGQVTESKALQWGARQTVLDALKAVEVASTTVQVNNTPALTLDLSKVKDFAVNDTLALLILSGNQVYTYSATTDKFPFLSDVKTVDVPEVPTIEAKLGWNGKAFTIDYVANKVTPVEGATYAVKVNDGQADLEGGKYDPATDNGAGIVPNDTNRIYSATSTVTVDGVVFEAKEAVKAGIYGLVMKAIAASELNGQINAEQLAVVNEVLKNGNILLTNGELTDAAKSVMTISDDKTTITLTTKAYNLGLRFTKGISSTDGTTSADATVSTDGKSVTLAAAATEMAEVLSLEGVYLEFVPTDVSETQGDGADADLGLVDEL